MVKNEKIDNDVVKAIKKSSEKFKQLYPILVDANDEIIDGEHRRLAIKNPKTEKLDFIKTKKDRLEARLVANHARKGQNKETWEFDLGELGKILAREGIEKIGIKIAEETGLPYRTLMRYLPDEYKDKVQSERASHPRLPTASPEIVKPSIKETVPKEVFPEIEPLREKEKPKITIKEFVNQPWKAIIVPSEFYAKLEKICIERNLDIQEVITFALMKLLEDLRRDKVGKRSTD